MRHRADVACPGTRGEIAKQARVLVGLEHGSRVPEPRRRAAPGEPVQRGQRQARALHRADPGGEEQARIAGDPRRSRCSRGSNCTLCGTMASRVSRGQPLPPERSRDARVERGHGGGGGERLADQGPARGMAEILVDVRPGEGDHQRRARDRGQPPPERAGVPGVEGVHEGRARARPPTRARRRWRRRAQCQTRASGRAARRPRAIRATVTAFPRGGSSGVGQRRDDEGAAWRLKASMKFDVGFSAAASRWPPS